MAADPSARSRSAAATAHMVNNKLGPSSNANLTDHNRPWEKRHAVHRASPRQRSVGSTVPAAPP